ncbi:MAG: hypothetical protein CM1200mP29_04340 [Verrucomicrobiota bacterium]|nr:MAG: hypothetical protein CM1200mP29_04340 [Verrucomicrobiota bacterium]
MFTENYWDHQLSGLSSRMGKVNAKRRSLGNDKTLSAEERSKFVETYKADLFTEEEIRSWRPVSPTLPTTTWVPLRCSAKSARPSPTHRPKCNRLSATMRQLFLTSSWLM